MATTHVFPLAKKISGQEILMYIGGYVKKNIFAIYKAKN